MHLIHQLVSFVVIASYAILLLELIFLHVPSVASVYQLVWIKKSIINYHNEKLTHGRLYLVLHWPTIKKLLLLGLPTGISIITGLLPLIYIGCLLTKVCSWEQLNNISIMQNIVGMLLIICGRIFTVYATLVIRQENRQTKESFQLKTDGVFGFSRNPLLVGMYVMYVGMLVVFPQILFALGLFVYVLNMHFRILLEEDFLLFQFGKPFHEYQQHVRRYL
jgi:protein-S-isoprenylcysteine O-methyltransferase Ste14